MDRGSRHITLPYKRVDDLEINLDVYPPASTYTQTLSSQYKLSVPAVVYFHGGGLTVGNRASWFPGWLYRTYSYMPHSHCRRISSPDD